jgi:PAS domain S-box-containing protein
MHGTPRHHCAIDVPAAPACNPAHCERLTFPAPRNHDVLMSATQQPRILIVEDVPEDAELMLLALEQAGLCGGSRRVWNKTAFVDALRTFAPDVILSDFALPGFDGLTALGIRQLLSPDTPLIIVSGLLGEERAVQILKAGATDYVLKSDLTRLAPAVERALAEGAAQRDRKRIARELDAERRLMSAVLDSSAALIALLDPAGRLVRINAAAAQACGVTEAHARGRGFWDLFTEPCAAANSRATLTRILERPGFGPPLPPWREVTRLGRAVLWSASLLEEPGSSGEILVLAGIDVTGQQQQQETNARLATIVDSSEDAILSKTIEGTITSWNHGAERLFGYSAAEAVGSSVMMLVMPGYEEEERRILERIRDGEPVSHFETVRRRKDGQQVSVSMTVSPMRDVGDGHVVGASTIARDISQRKRMEELRLRSVELEAENERMLAANRLKSEFLANMSHELRTPLNAVIGFSDLLRDGLVPPDSPKHKEFLDHISTSGHHLLRLINDILDLSKVEAGKLEFFPEPLDLVRTVQEVTAILGSTAAAKHIRVGADIDPGLGMLRLDPGRLKQVLYNFLSNALKFTPAQGSVTVRAQPEGDDHFRLEVEDTGIGIAEQDINRLFVEFQQLDAGNDRVHAGTGLGLALTRRLVEAQGGTVGVRSTPGRGSVFHAVLPRQAAGGATLPEPRSVAAVNPAQAPAGEPELEVPSVLVVEDDPQDQAALISTLTQAGFNVETAATGAQAIARAREKAFSAVTLDLLLPDMTGLDVLASIRAEGLNCDVPVVVVTVVAGRSSVAGFAVSDILPKPIQKSALLAALRRADAAPQGPGNVLVVNDDSRALQFMGETLEQLGYHAVCRSSGADALAELDQLRPQAIILDIMMQDIDGVAFLDQLRQQPQWRHTPVFLWADKELGFNQYARLAASAETALHHGQGSLDTLLQDLDAILPVHPAQEGTHGRGPGSGH